MLKEPLVPHAVFTGPLQSSAVTPANHRAPRNSKAAMAQPSDCDPKVRCPACEAPVSMQTGIVDLGACSALLCPHCGELSFPKSSTDPVRRR